MIGTGPVSAAAFRAAGGGTAAPAPSPSPTPTPTPTPIINTIVIEGDSITSDAPSTPNGNFGYQYDDSRPDKTIEVRAQNSRSIGVAGQLNDNGNTLFGNVAEDAAYAPDLIAFKIGANDLPGITDATYRSRLIDLRAAYNTARAAMKVAWSPPIPYNPTGTPHPSKADFDTGRASLLADCRNPAVWGQWCDFYMPMGEHPDFADPATAAPLFGDSVHPSGGPGQSALYAVFRPFMDSLLDASRASSTAMYNAAWLGNETNLAVSTRIHRRIVVSGLTHTGTALGASVTGGGGPQIRVGGRAWGASVGTGSGNGHRLYNGDVLELAVTPSAANNTAVSVDLTIGSETRTLTYTTVAQVTPAAYTHGGFAQKISTPAGNHLVPAITFPAAGLGLIAVHTGDGGAGKPTGLTWNGVAATEVFGLDGWTQLALWRVPVTAGTAGDVVISYAAGRPDSVISYGTLTNADPVPVSVLAAGVSEGDHPSYSTQSITVPASGIAIAFMAEDGAPLATTGTVTTGTHIVSAKGGAVNGFELGLVGGRRATTGAVIFNSSKYGGKGVGIAAFKAAGT